MQTPQKCAVKWYFRPRERQKSARMWHESAHFVHRFKNQERTEVTDNIQGCPQMTLCGISSRFQLLSPTERQVSHALLTRSPLSITEVIPRSTCMC